MLSQVLAAIIAAIGAISGLIQIYEAISKHPGPPPQRRLFQWIITIGTLSLALIIFLLNPLPETPSVTRSSQTPANSRQGTTITAPTATQNVIPTPTLIPPTFTPVPLSQCADQHGAPPNGPVATKLMVNCALPSGSVVLIVVCNEAHLLQPFDNQLQGPGIISYENNSAASSSISIEAQNTALSNASCPAKLLVVSPGQVDGQINQEVQRLKNLIGNNAGVTWMKVVGENVTKTYY